MKNILYYILGLTLYYIFRIPIEDVLKNYVIVPFTQKVDISVYTTSATSIISGIILMFLFSTRNRKAYHAYFIPKLFIIGLWGYYRFISDTWTLYPAHPLNTIKLIDILILPSAVSALYDLVTFIKAGTWKKEINNWWNKSLTKIKALLAKFKKHSKQQDDNAISVLHLDTPIKDTKEDLFDLKDHVQLIKDYILYSPAESRDTSLTIGIVAPWGHGKTSFLNLLEKKIHSECIIIKFTPWIYEKDNLTKHFFDELASQLKPHGLSISKLRKYSAKLSGVGSPSLDFAARFVHICTNQSQQEQFEDLNTKISAIKKPIVVFIDDIDRLDADEIINVLKLIRATANFSNISYVVTMDKSYILHTLKENNLSDSANYLEKFFQHELYIPQNPEEEIKEALWKMVQSTVAQTDKNELEYLRKGIFKEKRHSNCTVFLKCIHNMRDAIKLANLFNSKLAIIRHEVNLVDFMNLCILNYKYPTIYYVFEKNYKSMLVPSTSTTQKGEYYKLATKGTELLEANEYNLKVLCLTEAQLTEARELLSKYIFTSNDKNQTDHAIRINYEHAINRYFLNKIDLVISHNLFTRVYESEYDKFQEIIEPQLDQWCRRETHKDLIERIRRFPYNKSVENYKKVIHSYFYMGTKDIYSVPEIGHEINTVLRNTRLSDETNNDFIKQTLKKYTPSYFAAAFIHDYLLDENFYLGMEKEELQAICIAHFNSYLKSTEIDKTDILRFWKFTILYTYKSEPLHIDSYPGAQQKILDSMSYSEGNALFLKYIEKNTKTVFNHFITQPSTSHYELVLKKLWHIEQNTPFEDIISKLESLKEDKYVNEFLKFYDSYKRVSYRPIPFTFKHIKPSKKR